MPADAYERAPAGIVFYDVWMFINTRQPEADEAEAHLDRQDEQAHGAFPYTLFNQH